MRSAAAAAALAAPGSLLNNPCHVPNGASGVALKHGHDWAVAVAGSGPGSGHEPVFQRTPGGALLGGGTRALLLAHGQPSTLLATSLANPFQ